MPHLVSAPRLDCCLSFGKVNKIKFKLVKFRKSFWENSSLFSYLPARIPFLLSSVLAIPFIAFNKLQKSYPTLAAIFSEMNPSSLARRARSLKLFLQQVFAEHLPCAGHCAVAPAVRLTHRAGFYGLHSLLCRDRK